MIMTMNEKLKKTWDYIVSECVGMRSKSINVGGHIRRAAVIAAADELDRNEEFCKWLPMSGWYYGELNGAWWNDHEESNAHYKFEDVVNAWMVETGRKEARE
jgi:hypothetical protein